MPSPILLVEKLRLYILAAVSHLAIRQHRSIAVKAKFGDGYILRSAASRKIPHTLIG